MRYTVVSVIRPFPPPLASPSQKERKKFSSILQNSNGQAREDILKLYKWIEHKHDPRRPATEREDLENGGNGREKCNHWVYRDVTDSKERETER